MIELLVVIAIIALLLSILTPALKKAKDQARGLVCSAHLKQFGLAWHLYAEDNDNRNIRYIPASAGEKGKFWFYQLASYFGDDTFAQGDGDSRSGVMEIMNCPATREWTDRYGPDPGFGVGYGASDMSWHYKSVTGPSGSGDHEGSYLLNGWMQERPGAFKTDKRFYQKYTDAHGQVPLIADGGFVDAWPVGSDADRSSELINLDGAGYPGTPLRMGTSLPRLILKRHGRAINILFKGMNVEKVKLEKVWSYSWHKGFETVSELDLPSE